MPDQQRLTLSFGGSQGVISANVDQTSTIVVHSPTRRRTTSGLDAGTGSGASVERASSPAVRHHQLQAL